MKSIPKATGYHILILLLFHNSREVVITLDNSEPLTYFINAISQVGYPIVLTGYLFLRFEKKIDKLTETIEKLSDIISSSMNGKGKS